MSCQAILDQQQAEIAAKLRELEEAEIERKRVLEEQRLRQLAQAEEKRRVSEERLASVFPVTAFAFL